MMLINLFSTRLNLDNVSKQKMILINLFSTRLNLDNVSKQKMHDLGKNMIMVCFRISNKIVGQRQKYQSEMSFCKKQKTVQSN